MKTPQDSITEMTEIVLPTDGNVLGSAFGGKVMQWIDVCGAITAQRHCRTVVVTASMDELHFHAAIKVGHVATLRARINAAFNRSVEVGVEVHSENPLTGARVHCCSALLTFTALDGEGRPIPVPPLRTTGPEDEAIARAAHERREARLANRRRSVV